MKLVLLSPGRREPSRRSQVEEFVEDQGILVPRMPMSSVHCTFIQFEVVQGLTQWFQISFVRRLGAHASPAAPCLFYLSSSCNLVGVDFTLGVLFIS